MCLVQAATDPAMEGMTGKYFVQGKLAESSVESYDLEAARRLWQISEGLVGQSFAFGTGLTSHSPQPVLASPGESVMPAEAPSSELTKARA